MSNGKSNPAPAASEGLDLSGRTVGDFHVLRKLGQGGMGQVYLAEQISLRRNVALKILRPELAASPTALQRFKAEAEAVARAPHANIVQVYAYGVEEGMAYMALEFVEGKNLKEVLALKGSPDLPVALSLMRQVAAALQRASELGLIHRDIKPENILLTRKVEVKVADFGLVRCLEGEDRPALNLTQTGVTMGTPLYMSPEQVEGKPLDPRTDIYSFGVTCYHMLAGQPPFRGESAFEVALQHVQKEPVPLARIRPDLPEALCAIVHKMMAKDPAQRYQTGRDLARDVARLKDSLSGTANSTLAGQGILAMEAPAAHTTATPPEETRTQAVSAPRSRRGLLIAAVIVTILGAAGGGAVFAWKERQRAGPLPHGKDLAPADAGVTDTIPLPSKEELALRNAVEQYLNPPSGKVAEGAGGFGVCMDLGLFYLEHQRRDDADKLFTRLESVKDSRSYKMLGQVGRGIVLALQDQPKDSNRYFREVFGQTQAPPVPPKLKDKGFPPYAFIQRQEKGPLAPLVPLLDKPRWRYWLARARWYNSQNGIAEDEVPYYLRYKVPLREGALEQPRPGPKSPAKPEKDRDKEKPPRKEKDKAG